MIRPHNPNPEFELGALKKVDLPDGIDLEPARWTKQFGAAPRCALTPSSARSASPPARVPRPAAPGGCRGRRVPMTA